MLLLIDGDILLHRFAYANQFSIDWYSNGEFVTIQDKDTAVKEMESFIEHLVQKCEVTDFVVCLSSDFNFRYEVLPSYKHNRTGEKPELYYVLLEHMTKHYPHESWRNLEADDVMGVLATQHLEQTIIATLDKDLDQIPGWHYNWNKDSMYHTTQQYGLYWFFRQILTGDSTDGYKGCPGIGPKKADALVGSLLGDNPPLPVDVWQTVVEAYERKGLTEADAIQQARVARILQTPEYNRTTGKITLWQPPVIVDKV